MTLSTVLPALLLLLGCLLFIFWPQKKLQRVIEKTRVDYLEERKDVLYDNLRDLNFEYRAGKYPEADYAAQRDSLEIEAAGVIAEIEKLENSGKLDEPVG